MTSIADVRESLAAAVKTVIPVCDAYLSDIIVVPSAQVSRKDMTPGLILGDTKQTWKFGVMVFAGRAVEQEGQRYLDLLCEPSGSTSLKAAVEDGSNWTATVDYARVTSIGQPKIVETDQNVQYLSCEFEVEVVW